MFSSMFKTIFKNVNKNVKEGKKDLDQETIDIARLQIDHLLTETDNNDDNVIEENASSCSNQLPSINDNVNESFTLLAISDIPNEILNDSDLFDNFDDDKSDVSSVEENKPTNVTEVDLDKKKLINQIGSLQCLFTWNIKPKHKKNVILSIENNYGKYNLDISKPEFTFERYIGNIIIGYEMFNKGETELAQMKILNIGKWLEELDNSTDEFYKSIKIGLKHVMTATFIHMLFATNLTEECKWLLKDIDSYANMDSKSRATVLIIRAAVLTEYGDNTYLNKACEYAKKACTLDPNTPHWFYIYSRSLTAQRHFLYTYKSCPTEFEIHAIQQANLLSNENNIYYNYQRMILNKETIVNQFHNNVNKHDKSEMDKNQQENRTIIEEIKTIMSMDPKDPHLVIKCARILITLPWTVRQLKLGKQYLRKAIDMALDDSSVIFAVTKTVDVYNEILKRNEKNIQIVHNNPTVMNKPITIREELRIAVNKHKNGDDPLPYLINLADKYNGHNKYTIMAQICSYTILFTNNLRSGVEQFITLIELQPDIINTPLITNHFSSFGSKKFNLAELFCNEIKLATNSSKTPSEDMLFYYKMLTKIMETFNLNVKDVDPSMKNKLIVDSCTKSTSKNANNVLDDECVNSEVKNKNKNKNSKPKHLQNTGPKKLTKKIEKNKEGTQKKNETLKNSNASKNVKKNTKKATATNSDELKLNWTKFFASSNNSTLFNDPEKLRNLKTQAEMEQYTKQLYQNILTNTQQQHNLQSNNFQDHNMFFNQNQPNLNPFLELRFPNQQPPPLLSLRPQINQQNLQPTSKKSANNLFFKKK